MFRTTNTRIIRGIGNSFGFSPRYCASPPPFGFWHVYDFFYSSWVDANATLNSKLRVPINDTENRTETLLPCVRPEFMSSFFFFLEYFSPCRHKGEIINLPTMCEFRCFRSLNLNTFFQTRASEVLRMFQISFSHRLKIKHRGCSKRAPCYGVTLLRECRYCGN